MTVVAEGLLPPFAQPTGPLVPDDAVVRAFAAGEPGGYSQRLHVEASVLLANRAHAVALRLTRRALLVRADPPDDAAETIPRIEQVLSAIHLERIDERTLFGVPVAVQLVGLRLSEWDLWGDDMDLAFAALRAVAAGEHVLHR